MRFTPRFFSYVFLGWSVEAVLQTLFSMGAQAVAGTRGSGFLAHLQSAMHTALLMAALTPLVVWLAWRFPIDPPHRLLKIARHALLGLGVAALFMGAWAATSTWVGEPLTQPFLAYYLRWADANLFTYFVLVAGAQAYRERRRLDQRELESVRLTAQLSEARLELLKMQLHPHFLFNTLNTVAELVHQDADAADRTITRLSELLRAAIRLEGHQAVPVRDELAMLTAYVEIQQARFGERLAIRLDIQPDAYDASVPPLVLQPLVENAIRHGLASRAAAGVVHVSLRVAGNRLLIAVSDDGIGLPSAVVEGLGIRNTRARLREMYAGDYSLALAARPGGGAVASISIPLVRASAPPERTAQVAAHSGAAMRPAMAAAGPSIGRLADR